jgi:hypothetical protein
MLNESCCRRIPWQFPDYRVNYPLIAEVSARHLPTAAFSDSARMLKNNFLSSISILVISVKAHHQVPCEHDSMDRPLANGRHLRSPAPTDRQQSSKTDKVTCLLGLNE